MGQRTGLGTRLEQAARLSPVEVRPNLVAGWLSPEVAACLIVALLAPADRITLVFAVTTLGALAGLGGRCGTFKGAGRVTFWGALVMVATALVGRIFGVTAQFSAILQGL